MNDSIIAYIDRVLTEYEKSKQLGLAMALTFFYSEVLQDRKYEPQRQYCEKRLQESTDPFLQGFFEIFFKSEK